MLLSVFNLLMRWLFFVAIIWPVRAEATKKAAQEAVQKVTQKTVQANIIF